MIAQLLVLVALPALLAAAALYDLASFTIPNFLSLALIALFPFFAMSAGLEWTVLGWHLAAGLAALVLGFALFALGWIGGGDAKLFAAVALWLGFSDLSQYAVLVALCGGGLALLLLLARRVPLPRPLLAQSWALKLHDGRAGIPYGVALAAGAFFLLPQTEIFRIAAAV